MGLFDEIRKRIAPKPKPIKVIRPKSHPVPAPIRNVPPPAAKEPDRDAKGNLRRYVPERSPFDDNFERITKHWTPQQWKVWRSFAGQSRDPQLAQDFYDGYIDPNPPGGKSRRIRARRELKQRLRGEYGFDEHTFSQEFDWDAWKMENEGSVRE